MAKEKILRAKWGSPDSPLKIGDREIQCYVLEDGTRVLSGRGMQDAIGLGQAHGSLLRSFMGQKALKDYINNDLAMELKNPLRFIRPGRGGKPALAYEATILPKICDAILEAREKLKEKLTEKQQEIAYQCELLTRGLSRVGIIALVDEATGYQDARVKDALAQILEDFIAKERRPYIGTFPTEFYRQVFRLNNWPWKPESTKRPGVIAKWTNDLIYDRIAPGVLDELKKRNPTYKPGQRQYKHFQFLSEKVGEPKLRSHFDGLIALAKAAPNWRKFKDMVNRVYPKKWDQLLLDIDIKE